MRWTGCILAVALLVTAVSAPAAGAAFGGLGQEDVNPDVVVMDADIGANGDAQWMISYRVRLADDNETQAFEELQSDIRTNQSLYTDRFQERMARTARAGENTTGREMTIENVTVTATQENLGQRYGVVSYRFEWTNFAQTSDGEIEAGDALAGLFLDGDTSLTLRWPSEYEAQTVVPEPDEQTDQSATWRGQRSFGTDEPRVVATTGGSSGGPSGLLIGVAIVAVLVVAGALLARRKLGGGDAGDSGAGAGATGGSATAAADEPPEELLSNEEQVLQLLEENGGRIKQQQVASELEWTDAKTSQVIGGLREDDEVETFRIGRENVVTLPGTDLTEKEDDGDQE